MNNCQVINWQTYKIQQELANPFQQDPLVKYQAGGGFRSIHETNPGFKDEGTAVPMPVVCIYVKIRSDPIHKPKLPTKD
ncbi:hypothetical protein NC651_003324 [Populus alba x Populus x berolinensis]|nr:hypothetical protein NC651_003324 [Populus alba x Populus x berolinensis]